MLPDTKSRPRIGLTLDAEPPGGYSRLPWYAIRANYCEAIVRAGGVPIALPHEVELVDVYLEMLDGLVVTGPVSENMRTALLETYAAIPAPRVVIAVGADAISGGVFRGRSEVHDGCGSLVPVDLFIPGWPPHPLTILDGLLRLLGRLDGGGAQQEGPSQAP